MVSRHDVPRQIITSPSRVSFLNADSTFNTTRPQPLRPAPKVGQDYMTIIKGLREGETLRAALTTNVTGCPGVFCVGVTGGLGITVRRSSSGYDVAIGNQGVVSGGVSGVIGFFGGGSITNNLGIEGATYFRSMNLNQLQGLIKSLKPEAIEAAKKAGQDPYKLLRGAANGQDIVLHGGATAQVYASLFSPIASALGISGQLTKDYTTCISIRQGAGGKPTLSVTFASNFQQSGQLNLLDSKSEGSHAGVLSYALPVPLKPSVTGKTLTDAFLKALATGKPYDWDAALQLIEKPTPDSKLSVTYTDQTRGTGRADSGQEGSQFTATVSFQPVPMKKLAIATPVIDSIGTLMALGVLKREGKQNYVEESIKGKRLYLDSQCIIGSITAEGTVYVYSPKKTSNIK